MKKKLRSYAEEKLNHSNLQDKAMLKSNNIHN